MFAHISTLAFQGIEAVSIDVQVQMSSGLPAFSIVGLPDKAVAESKERIRAALHAIGLAMPAKRITVNLAPADVQKEGSHYDLPIALGLLVSMGAIPQDAIENTLALGELSLDGHITSVSGALPAAIHALSKNMTLICPHVCGSEAAWAGDLTILAPNHILALVNHFKGTQVLSPPVPLLEDFTPLNTLCMRDIKGQESAKRALEVAAAGGHNMLMMGPPGAGKSMLSSRLPSILPPLSPQESLDVTMIHSLAGKLENGRLIRTRPFRDPHHAASMPALVGGGLRAKPGEVSLAHHGVLFLDELPEFSRSALEALRQPLESGTILVSRANGHFTYPSQVQLIAAMNPCRCGHLADAERGCSRAPKCANDYQSKISGPLMDRIDIHIDVPEVSVSDMARPAHGASSQEISERVERARHMQQERYTALKASFSINARADGEILDAVTQLDAACQDLLKKAAESFKLSARGYRRVLRLSRTIADLDGSQNIQQNHLSEALSYRKVSFK